MSINILVLHINIDTYYKTFIYQLHIIVLDIV